MNCRYCGHTHLQRRGIRRSLGKEIIRYKCTKCGKFQTSEPRHLRSARILLLDIETLLMEFYAFSPYVNNYLPPQNMKKDWSIACWAAKWLFEPEIMGDVVSGKEAKGRVDSSVLDGVWKLLDEADIVVWHNGDRFDKLKLNTRFLLAGYPPPSHYLSVDTKAVAKQVFGHSYNHLNELGKKFGIGEKDDMEFEDWVECSEGNEEYLKKMITYCKRDVTPLLEDVYLVMLPWMPSHPNLNIFTNHDMDVCPKCESSSLSWNSTYKTPQGLWEGFRCSACGAIGRGTTKYHKIKSTSVK